MITLPLRPGWEGDVEYRLGWRSRWAVLWTGIVRVVR